MTDYWKRVKEAAYALKGDGCTDAPDLTFRLCCDEHDVHYRTHKHLDGTHITKQEADKRLYECMKKKSITPVGKYIIAPIYFLAVKVFAQPAWDKSNNV